jgi:hypothetical protein
VLKKAEFFEPKLASKIQNFRGGVFQPLSLPRHFRGGVEKNRPLLF